jgi:hypothetical protein
MKQIENIEQLRSEIGRVRTLAKKQELQIKSDLKSIREDLKPENIFWNSVSSLTGFKINKNELFKDGIAYGLSLIVQRYVLKTEKKMENKIYNVVDSIFDRVKSFVNKFAGAEAKRNERKQEKEDFFTNE